MNKLSIKSLTINNFKGIKSLVIEPSDCTNIYGTNGSFKTTIVDAYHWCLFGKNSADENDFNIKRLDAENNPEHKLEHSVEIVLTNTGGYEMRFKRIYKETWTKPRGQAELEFAGHETNYEYNEVPLSQKEYKDKVDIIIPESVFKILSNPLYFNQKLKWNERRVVLFKLVNDISDSTIAEGKEAFKTILNQLTGKTIDMFKRELTAKKKRLNDDLVIIPNSVLELQKQKPETVDIEEINKEIAGLKASIDTIDAYLSEINNAQNEKNKANAEALTKIGELKVEIQKLEQDQKIPYNSRTHIIAIEINNLQNEINLKENELKNRKTNFQIFADSYTDKNMNRQALRDKYKNENEKTLAIDQFQFSCPTCKREYIGEDLESNKIFIQERFNSEKSETLQRINNIGLQLKSEIENLEKQMEENNEAIKVLEGVLNDKKAYMMILNGKKTDLLSEPFILQETDQIRTIKTMISDLEKEIVTIIPVNNQDKIKQKGQYQLQIDELNKKLGVIQTITRIDNRIEELLASESLLAQQIADLENQLFNIDEFTRYKVTMIEGTINKLFTFVKFKMYEQLVNGNLDDTCVCLINGVPFSDANHASKINAGIDIINVLSKFYNISLPILIDNRESIVNLIPFEGQLINLIVSEKDKGLRIENN